VREDRCAAFSAAQQSTWTVGILAILPACGQLLEVYDAAQENSLSAILHGKQKIEQPFFFKYLPGSPRDEPEGPTKCAFCNAFANTPSTALRALRRLNGGPGCRRHIAQGRPAGADSGRPASCRRRFGACGVK
jgi:hypothetical protein